METKEIKALIKRIEMSITAIEKKLGMSQGTLNKASKGERGLNEMWHTPLRALADIRRFERFPHLKNHVKAKYGEKDLIPVKNNSFFESAKEEMGEKFMTEFADNVIMYSQPTNMQDLTGNQPKSNYSINTLPDQIKWEPVPKDWLPPTLERQSIPYVPFKEQSKLPEFLQEDKVTTTDRINNLIYGMEDLGKFCLEHSCTPQDLINAYLEKNKPIPRPSGDMIDLLG